MARDAGINRVPQYTDLDIVFSGITKNGSSIDVTGDVQYWRFAAATGEPSKRVVTKNTTATGAGGDDPGDFSLAVTSVTVSLDASGDLNYAKGPVYVNLYAETSGTVITHLQKNFTIQEQVAPS